MDIVVVGRATEISEKYRSLIEQKLEKAVSLAPDAQRVDVVLTHERNPRQADKAERIEITMRGKGPVVRAEASSSDRVAALDLALAKLLERLRRARDRRKDHHGRPPLIPVDVRPLTAEDPKLEEDKPKSPPPIGEVTETTLGDSPVIIREKTHAATPLSVSEALYEMELVGHDFFLFIDADSNLPAVVYRRRGWSYGVIRLDTNGASAAK